MPQSKHRHPIPSLLVFLIVIVSGVAAPATLGGCGGGGQSQQKALRVALNSVNSASSGFVAWDAYQQSVLVARAPSLQAGREALAAHRERRDRVAAAFETAYKVIAVAAIDPTAENVKLMLAAVFDLLASIDVLRNSAPAASPPGAPPPKSSLILPAAPRPLPGGLRLARA